MKRMLSLSNGFSTWNFKLPKAFAHCAIPSALVISSPDERFAKLHILFSGNILRILSVQ